VADVPLFSKWMYQGADTMNNKIKRVVVWFSAGVTSAVAAKMTIDKYKGVYPVRVVMCDTGSEHEDNARFTNEVSDYLGVNIEIIRNEKYTDTFDVYEKTGWLVGPKGARCSLELKKKPRQRYERINSDLQVFGFDFGEGDRALKFAINNPLVMWEFPLIKAAITKTEARQMLASAGIAEPLTYQMGFDNANCLARGCVKGGMGYWNHYRKIFPRRFDEMAKMEREIGAAICKRYIDGERVAVYLDELPTDAGRHDGTGGFQCGLFCGEL